MENSFKEFDRVLETGDKQAVPIRQQDALGYVGQIEEAMVKEFPYQVPSDYDYLPQLRVSIIYVVSERGSRHGAVRFSLPLSEKGKQQAAMQGKHLLASSHRTTTSQIDSQCLTANMGSAARPVGSCHSAQLKLGCPLQGILTRLHLQDQTLVLRNSLSDRRCAAPCLVCTGKVPHSTVMCRAGPQWR